MTVDMALRLWRRGEPVPVANAPTLMKPLETHAVGGDVLIEAYVREL